LIGCKHGRRNNRDKCQPKHDWRSNAYASCHVSLHEYVPGYRAQRLLRLPHRTQFMLTTVNRGRETIAESGLGQER
jgi:hypothetical protein